MTIADEFGPLSHVRPVTKLEIDFNKEIGKITGGKLHVTICEADGDNNLRRQIPLSVLGTITAANRTYVQNLIDTALEDLLTQTGKTLLPTPPPEEP